jgi:uncharacterized protein (TIGR02453 family)
MFTGFSEKTIEFLNNLNQNNNKVWFESHRNDYQEFVLEPFRSLVMDLSEFMLTIDPHFVTAPAVNKTISRIHRDTRFSKNKALYRSNMWLVFKRRSKDWKVTPAYFFEIFPDYYRYGMGFYSATPDSMRKFRELIDAKPDDFLNAAASAKLNNLFELKGEKYKRILNKEKGEEIQDWYQRKNFYLVCNREITDILFNKALVDDLMSGFSFLAPLYQFIWRAIS